jgi:hypothetical protein
MLTLLDARAAGPCDRNHRVEKLIYLLWSAGDRDRLAKRMLDDVAPGLLALAPRALSLNLDDAEADVPPPVPWPADEPALRAQVSLWLDCYDRRGPFEALLADVGERLAGYLVSESLYTDYGGNHWSPPRSWPDGQRSPGVLTVTLLERPARLTREDWVARWHGVQSPLSEQIQPRARYVRNAVVWAVTPGAPPLEGIVEEAWPSAGHVTDPMLFYCGEGSAERMRQNLGRMLESVRAFLDLDRVRNQTMSEYLLKTAR